MEVKFLPHAQKEYLYWLKKDQRIANKINELIQDIQTTPFAGLGLPEALKHQWTGAWSRRITQEHRLIYIVEDDVLTVLQCRFHYQK